MKKLFIILFFMIISLNFYCQNISNGSVTVATPLTPLPGLTATGAEAFRFRSGLVTQSDAGSAFTFEADKRWFSIGKLNVGLPGSATERILYGLRLQRSGQGLTMGYGTLATSPNAPSNPFIEWIGNNLLTPSVDSGNLEFYTTNNPGGPSGPGIRKLSFTLRSDLTALLGETSIYTTPFPVGFLQPKLEINVVDNRDALAVFTSTSTPSSQSAQFSNTNSGGVAIGLSSIGTGSSTTGESIGIRTNGSGTYFDLSGQKLRNAKATGLLAIATNASISNIGISTTVSNAAGIDNYGVKVEANIKGQNNYGMYSNLVGSTVAGSVNYGIYSAASGVTGTLAGFFNGAIVSTGSGTFSDKSIKKDVKKEENILLKLQRLNPVNYTFIQEKEKTGLNLPTTLQHGFIAQEIEKVFPELVMDIVNPIYNDKSELIGKKDLKAVNYIGMISVLASSIKELNEVVIKDLKDEIQLLKDALNSKEQNTLKSVKESINSNEYFLGQNTPNPFSDNTTIEYVLPRNEKSSTILIFDLSGKTIKEFKLNNSKGVVTINQGELQKGMYIYCLTINNTEIASKKMIIN